MTEKVRFYFDPGCPWAWQTSLWIREVERFRDIEIEWRLFSLKLANAGEDDPFVEAHENVVPALRVLALARQREDNDLTGRLYEAFGNSFHERGEKATPSTVRKVASEVGLADREVEEALTDPATLELISAEHREAVERVGGFGVPTIILESGKGIFGPVVATAPKGEDAGELWDRVRWLIEADGFYELKRNRDRRPGS